MSKQGQFVSKSDSCCSNALFTVRELSLSSKLRKGDVGCELKTFNFDFSYYKNQGIVWLLHGYCSNFFFHLNK
jgi:hypothetical protein